MRTVSFSLVFSLSLYCFLFLLSVSKVFSRIHSRFDSDRKVEKFFYSMYSIIKTQKGYDAILFEENMYRKQHTNRNGSTRWVCTNRSCACSLTIRNNTIEKKRGIHKHDKLERSLSVINTINDIREKVSENFKVPVSQIYNEAVANYVSKFKFAYSDIAVNQYVNIHYLATAKWYS